MIKQLILLLNLLAILMYQVLFPSGVSIENNTPGTMQPGGEAIVEITVNKGEISSFAKLEQIIPAGFTVEQKDNAGATFSFTDQKVKYIWMSLPNDASFKISYKLKATPGTTGNHTITGKFSFIQNNERSSVDIPPANISIGGGEVAVKKEEPKETPKEEPKVEVKETPKEEPKEIPTEKPEMKTPPTPVVFCKRTVTATGNGTYKVSLSLEKENIEGFVKIEDQLPDGFAANEMQSAKGTFSFSDNKVKIMWVAVPADRKIEVAYTMLAASAQSGNFSISGAVSYMHGEENKKFLLDNSSFTFTAPEPVAEKPAEKPKEEVKKEQPPVKEVTPKKEEPVREPVAHTNRVPSPEGKVSYKVQICASSRNVSDTYFRTRYQITDKIQRDMHQGLHKYLVGGYANYKDARDKRNTIWNNNKITDAFVTAYNGGTRITIQEALMISNQKWIQ